MRVAAYQAPLAATRSPDVLRLLADQVTQCEAAGVEVLCCPEGILGGQTDVALAAAHGVSVIRADVAGVAFGLRAYGSTEIVGPAGQLLADGTGLEEGLVAADIV